MYAFDTSFIFPAPPPHKKKKEKKKNESPFHKYLDLLKKGRNKT